MSKKKRVAIIGTAGIPAAYGGFEMLAEQLVVNLHDQFDFTVYCSTMNYGRGQRQKSFKGARLKYVPLHANGVQSIFYDSLSILHAVFTSDILFVMGVAGAWILPYVKFLTRKKIVVLVNGIEWKRARWGMIARWYLFWAESKAIKYSHIDILDNESIQDYTALRYGSLSRVIEYGADHVSKEDPGKQQIDDFEFLQKPYAFLDFDGIGDCQFRMVMDVYAKLPGNRLVVVGNDCKKPALKKQLAQYAALPNVDFLNYGWGSSAYSVIKSNAALYLYACNRAGTEPRLIEAMSLGLPVIAFNISYNRTTTQNKALFFSDAAELEAHLRELKPSESEQIGEKMQDIARRRYTWPRIAKLYEGIFKEALTARDKIAVNPKFSKLSEDKLLELGLGHLKHQQSFFEKR
jgi:glycosyltransferase involved in cell wall biosynthesis